MIQSLILSIAVILFGCGQAIAAPSDAYQISGPYSHENLYIYLIEPSEPNGAKDIFADGKFLTLSEAIKLEQIVVHETGTVSELAVENLSKDKPIFIQAGEIVKGGKQDRVLSRDLLLEPLSGKIEIGAFCVEQHRWQKRGTEDAKKFNASSKMLSSKQLKISNQVYRRQAQVWDGVKSQQDDYLDAFGPSAQDKGSPSSLQLSLESKAIAKRVAGFVAELGELAKEYPETIGFAYAIHGELNSAEIYSSSRLFQRQWTRLLESAAAEALSLSKSTKALTPPPSKDEVARFLRQAEQGSITENVVHSGTAIVTRDAKEAHFQESRRGKADKRWLHRSYLRK